MGCSRKIGDSAYFDFQAGERVRVGKPPGLVLHLPAEPTVQGDLHFWLSNMTMGQKSNLWVNLWLNIYKQRGITRRLAWIKIGVNIFIRYSGLVVSELITFRKRAGYITRVVVL